MRAHLSSVCLAVFLGCALAADARADDLIGEPWEEPILTGIQRQEQERVERRPETILRQAELLAARRADGPTRVARLYLLARAYGIAGDVPSALSTYGEVLALAPRCYFAHHDMALLQLQGDRPDRAAAERQLRQAIAIHPRYLTAYRKLGRVLLEGERRADAVPVLRRVIDLDPRDLQARYLLAQTLLELRRLEEAEREIVALVRNDPRTPAFRELQGDLYLARGRYDDARRVYERLAKDHPTVSQPLRKCLRVLNEQRQKEGTVDEEAWLRVLEGLYRLERDPTRRAELRKAIDEFRVAGAEQPPPDATGPPSDAQLVQVLARAPADVRVKALRYVYSREEAPEDVLVQAVIRHLSPQTEPTAAVRQWALRVLGRFGGFGLVGLVRHSLGDPDPGVRPVAVDALVALARTGPAARGAAVLALGLYAEGRDRVLATAARAGILELAQASVPAPAEETYEAEVEAFRTWWGGPVAAEVKIAALEEFEKVRDLFPEDVLLRYLTDADPYVLEATWQRMTEAARRLLDAPGLSPARRQWLSQLPPYAEGAARGPDAKRIRERLRAWAARKPGA